MRSVCSGISFLALATIHGAEPSGREVTIVENGASAWRIVRRSPASPAAAFAAEELRRYVQHMSGCELPLERGDPAGPAIVVGVRADLAATDRADLPPAASGHDGYAIRVLPRDERGRPARILVAGENGRGAAYGVYDLLERLGCRWFYPQQDPADPEVVPARRTLALEPGARAVASPMRFRICNGSAWFFAMDLAAASHELDWAFKNRYNAMGWQSESTTTLVAQYKKMESAGLIAELGRREMILHGPAHSFDHFLRAEDHLERHPEWFGLRDGKRVPQTFLGAQFCWSNAEARREFASNVEAFVRECPAIHILAIVPFDGGVACACPACSAIGAPNLLMTLMKEVIERLERSAPDLLVETVGGYGPVGDPPDPTAIHPKQRIVWAHWGRYHGMGYDDPRYDRRENLERWRKAAPGGITLCQYYTDNFCQPWIMPPFAVAIRGDRTYMIESRIDSVYVLFWPPGYWWNHSVNGYLAGRCFYDAALEPFAEIGDYAARYFGDGAGPLLGAYLGAWARDADLAYRVRGGTTDADRASLAEQRRRYIDPAVAAAKDDRVLAERVGRIEKLHSLAERLAALHRTRDQVRALRAAGEIEKAAELLPAARRQADEVLAFFKALADLDKGLIDRNEVPGFIAIGVKGWIEEEEKAIAEKKAGGP